MCVFYVNLVLYDVFSSDNFAFNSVFDVHKLISLSFSACER